MSNSKGNEKVVAFVLYAGVSLLEHTAAYAMGRSYLMSRSPRYAVMTVAESTDPLDTDTPLRILPARSFADVPRPDILYVMGAGGLSPLYALKSRALIDYVRNSASTASLVVGISSGALLLAAAGLLQGRKAATHWAYARLLERLGVQYVQDRWVEDGSIITTAGGTAGMDVGLELTARRISPGIARTQQLMAEYDPEPLFGGIDWPKVDYDALVPELVRRRETLHTALAGCPQVLAAVEDWILAADKRTPVHIPAQQNNDFILPGLSEDQQVKR